MAITLYDVSVASYLQVLGAVGGYLERGRQHLEAEGDDPDGVLGVRLFPDMMDFRFQVYQVTHHSRGAIEGARAGLFSPTGPGGPDTYAGLQTLIRETQAWLEALSADEVNGLEGRDMAFAFGERRMPFTVEGFLMSFSTPNLHFHATTAYDILRMKGVPLGKRDYMGRMRMKA
ncbi:MAG TPA: DUF1993 domain-containing protein [Phenylobacterium sp.]